MYARLGLCASDSLSGAHPSGAHLQYNAFASQAILNALLEWLGKGFRDKYLSAPVNISDFHTRGS